MRILLAVGLAGFAVVAVACGGGGTPTVEVRPTEKGPAPVKGEPAPRPPAAAVRVEIRYGDEPAVACGADLESLAAFWRYSILIDFEPTDDDRTGGDVSSRRLAELVDSGKVVRVPRGAAGTLTDGEGELTVERPELSASGRLPRTVTARWVRVRLDDGRTVCVPREAVARP